MQVKKYLILFICVFLLTNISLQAQKQIINGRVVDASNGKPVEFANLGIKGTSMGDATNQDGNFELTITPEVTGHQLSVSAVGYQTKEFKIATLPEKEQLIIELIPVIYTVDEVDVTAPSRVLYGMLKMVVRQIHNNYITDSYSSEVIYTETEEEGGRKKTIRLDYTDATGYLERSWYGSFMDRNYAIKSGRRNFDHSPFNDGMMRIGELLEFDYLRNPGNILDTVSLDYFDVHEKDKYLHNGQHVLVIGYGCHDPKFVFSGDAQVEKMSGEVHIIQNDMSLLKTVTTIQSAGRLSHGRSFMVNDELKDQEIKNRIYTVEATYEKVNDKKALKKVQMNTEEHLHDQNSPKTNSYQLIFENYSAGDKRINTPGRVYYDDVSIYSQDF